jgi:hypothetical protein
MEHRDLCRQVVLFSEVVIAYYRDKEAAAARKRWDSNIKLVLLEMVCQFFKWFVRWVGGWLEMALFHVL